MKTIRIFDSNADCMSGTNPFPDQWNPMLEFNETGNDNYHPWTVGDMESGGGWLSSEVVQETHDWLLKAGADPGEELLIKFGW